MSEKNINLESALQRLAFVSPSENYGSDGANIIRQNNTGNIFSNSGVGFGLTAALFLSIGFNLLQVSSPQGGIVENTQSTASLELQAADISETGSVFRFLCLTNTTVTINNSLNLGELKGFGEWVFFEAPNNYQVTVSLLPLREWNAIGQFDDGVISLQFDADDVMELRGVGIGPSGLKRGGPFPVYGNIQKSGENTVPTILASQSEPATGSGALATAAATVQARDQSTTGITNILAGVDTELGSLTQKYFGALLRSGECG